MGLSDDMERCAGCTARFRRGGCTRWGWEKPPCERVHDECDEPEDEDEPKAMRITLKAGSSPEWLAELCHGNTCPCAAFECPIFDNGAPDCKSVTPEMWEELMEEEE